MTMFSTPWTRSEILELLTLIAMIIISTIAAAWHILMDYKVSFPAKLRKRITLTSCPHLLDPATLKRQDEETNRGRADDVVVQ